MKKTALIFILIFSLSYIAFGYEDEPSIWAKEEIDELYKYDKIKEEAFTDFKSNINRLDFVYLTVRMVEIVRGEEIKINPSVTFTDTKDEYALKGATVGITSGIGNNKFGPKMLLTREQMATLLVNALEFLHPEEKFPSNMNQYITNFADDFEFSSWARNAIYICKKENILKGKGNNLFDSKGKTTREAALVVINRLLNNNMNPFADDMKNYQKLNEYVKVNNSLEVKMKDISITKKASINTITFKYYQKNISKKNIKESSLIVYFDDQSSKLIKGFSKVLKPGNENYRTLHINYYPLKKPLFVIIEADDAYINLHLKDMPKWKIED